MTSAVDPLSRAIDLLRRVEPELVPNHDEAQAVADKFGLGRVSRTFLIEDIREFLRESNQ